MNLDRSTHVLAPGRNALLAVALLAACAAGQRRIIVDQNGGGAHRDLPAAIAAAQAGDVLVVRPGDYTPFTLTKPVHIMAPEKGARVLAGSGSQGNKIHNLGAGQTATITGLVFDSPVDAGGSATSDSSVSILNCAGHVRLVDVQILNGPTSRYALDINNSNVSLQRSSAVGSAGGHGAEIEPGSSVHAADCSFEGGIGYCTIPCRTRYNPGVGLRMTGGRLRGTRLSILGGDTSTIYVRVGGIGCQVTGTSDLALRESTINGGNDTSSFGTGGGGLSNGATKAVRLDHCSLSGGVGRTSGPPFQGKIDQRYRTISGTLVSGALRTATTATLECSADPNTFVAIVASSGLDNQAVPSGVVVAITGAVIGPRGRFSVSFPIPDDPSMHYRHVWLTNVALLRGALEFAPPLGGPILPK